MQIKELSKEVIPKAPTIEPPGLPPPPSPDMAIKNLSKKMKIIEKNKIQVGKKRYTIY